MAKEKASESKSETIVGGSKAADFKPGTHAPVTTDAAAHTPPTHETGPATLDGKPVTLPLKPVVPGDDTPTTETPAERASRLNKPFNSRRAEFIARTLAEAEADANPVTVKDFIAQVKAFTEAAKAQNWLQMIQTGGVLLNTFAGLFAGPQVWGVTAEDAAAMEGADSVGLQLAIARQESGSALATRSVVSLDGGDPLPVSGSPMPMAAPSGVKGIDPATLLVLLELVGKLWAAFRNRK